MTEPVRLVENRYRAGVVARRLAAEAEEDVLSTMLDGVQAIFETPAWISQRAGQVIEELSDLRWDAKAAVLEVDDVFAGAVQRQPDMVDPDAWQAFWSRW